MTKIFLTVLLLLNGAHAYASGCGGPYASPTGRETVVAFEAVKFEYQRSGLRCEVFAYAPDFSYCSLWADNHNFLATLGKPPQNVFTDFAALDGKEVYISKVNVEYSEIDDCTGEQTRAPWWQGHHRLTAGAMGPFYAKDEDDLPPF